MADNGGGSRLVISYLTLRRAIGLMGVLLPVIVVIGCLAIGSCTGLLSSISSYYGTVMRDVFVGILFAIAWFLFAYKGYERKDDLAGDLACVFAMGVALFPTTSGKPLVRAVHLISAAALFLTLAYFSLALFTKTKPGVDPTPGKLKRNRVYRAAGYTMLACIVLMLVYSLFLTGTGVAALKPVFWLESIALWAFGWSWITKGEWLLADE